MQKLLSKRVAALNKLCFGEGDEFSSAQDVGQCRVYVEEIDGEIAAYALVAPGRISKLERYGVHPRHRGKGLGQKVLAQAGEAHPLTTTYVDVLNVHSSRCLLAAGYIPVGTTGEWITLLYANPRLRLDPA